MSNNVKNSIEEKLKSILSGKIYEKYGLKGNPFTPAPVNASNTFVNRELETEQILRYIVNLITATTPHIAILGNHGIGKTHFLKYIYNIIAENKKILDIKSVHYINGISDFENMFSGSNLNEYSIDKEKSIIFIDDLDIISIQSPKQVSNLFTKYTHNVIGTWNHNAWDKAKKREDIKVPKAEIINLEPLSKIHLSKILKVRLYENYSNEKKIEEFFPNNFIDTVVDISQGNPYKLITIARRYLDFLFKLGIEKYDDTILNKFADNLNIRQIHDLIKEIHELTEKQKDILKFIINNEEVSANQLKDEYGFSRVAAVQYLRILKNKKLLDSKEKDRIMYYYVPSEIVDQIDAELENKNFELD